MTHTPINSSSPTLEVSIFTSYAQIDDQASYGRISKIVSDIKTNLASQTGSEVELFQDKNSIAAGEDWRWRIRLGLSSSSIFLAFVSPSYLRSEACRQEFREFLGFLAANSETRLIIPLIYTEFDRLTERFQGDDIWEAVKQLQVLKIQHIRSSDPGSSEWMKTVEKISSRIEEVLNSTATSSSNELGQPQSDKGGDDDEEGILELLVHVEEDAPQIIADLNSYAQLMIKLGDITALAAPELSRAQTFGQRLASTRRLADALSPVGDEALEVSQRILQGLNKWDTGVHTVFEMLSRGQLRVTDEGTGEFLDAIHAMAGIGLHSLSEMDAVRTALDSAKGYSRPLNMALANIQASLLAFAEIRGIFEGWRNALDLLD
ncbi:toll/interleukin-1 receptor domain-containing protein [Nonomuraea sp. NPDC047529]|uniref:toll/interleukin-1 receptor domain-containing protein n=1 Tax=Nonomuraea sp. NPDC047529 TaxID=3155623 RepID=UPI0033EE05B0